MMEHLKKGVYWRRSLWISAMLAVTSASATLIDSPLLFNPATSLTVGGVTLPEAFQQAGDLTGLSVATDGNTLVIGAPQMAGANRRSFGANLAPNPLVPGSGTNPVNPFIVQAPGKVYVYQHDPNNSTAWLQVATLMARVGADKEGFGAAVAVDGNTIVVGADGASSVGGSTKQGRVYLFEKPVSGWSNRTITTETTELLPTLATPAPVPLDVANAYFGHAVDIKAGTVVVGQWGSVPAAYIFERPVAGWASAVSHAQTATLQPLQPLLGPAPPVQFGMSVAIDTDSAGMETVIVGGDLLGSGAVYVFEEPTSVGGWSALAANAVPTATLDLAVMSPVLDLLDNGQNGARSLGFDVDIKGNTIVAGAMRFDVTSLGGGKKDAGAAFVFKKPAAGWAATSAADIAMLTAPNPKAFQMFGRSVAITNNRILVGSFTNPIGLPKGRPDPVVGLELPGLAFGALPKGRAYLFDKPAAGWAVYDPALTPPELWEAPLDPVTGQSGSIDDMFGYSVAAAKTTYVAGGFALDTDLGADLVIDHNVGSVGVKESTVILNITNTLPPNTNLNAVAVGDSLSYTITVTNNDRTDTATNVIITDQLPAGLDLDPAKPLPANCVDLNAAVLPVQAAKVECALVDLLPQTSAEIILNTLVTDPLVIAHSASVRANESLNPSSVVTNSVNVAPQALAVASVGGQAVTSVDERVVLTLDGSASSDMDGTLTYLWVQLSSSVLVHLSDATVAAPTFTAPSLTVASQLPLKFQLTVTDNGGVSATTTVDVMVNDVTLPVINLLGANPDSVNYGSVYVDPGFTASDNVEGDLRDSVAVTGSIDTSRLGKQTLSYDVFDAAGNRAATVVRRVNVVDVTSPTIMLNNAGTITLKQGANFVDPGAVVSDNVDLDRTIFGVGAVDIETAGRYTLSYSATDAAGNVAVMVERTVIVTANVVNTVPVPVPVTTNVVNTVPVISGVPTARVVAGQSYSYALDATDANGDTLSYSLPNAPAWLTLDANGVLSGHPLAADVGSYIGMTVSVSDGVGSDSVTFDIEVTAVPAVSTDGGTATGGSSGGGGGSLPLTLLAALSLLGLRRRTNQ